MKKPLNMSVSAAAGLILANGGLLFTLYSARAATQGPRALPQLAAGGAYRNSPIASTAPRRQLPAAAAARLAPSAALNIMVNMAPAAPATGNPGVLDQRHQFALGMIETGNADGEIGGAGEVSRYQIMPSVWQRYTASRNYRNPQVSLGVARQHWAALHDSFKLKAGREPTDFDMYVLWNTHYGYYSGRNFNPARLSPVVRDRAQRYVNLVQSGDT